MTEQTTATVDVETLPDGASVTVKALWTMPGVEYGTVRTVTLGADLRRLIQTGRYQVLAAHSSPPTLAAPSERKTRRSTTAGQSTTAADAEPPTTDSQDGTDAGSSQS